MREKEVEDLKTKIAQVVAVADSFSPAALDMVGHSMVHGGTSKLLLGDHHHHHIASCTSNLDPNATAYTPKGGITSTEA